MVVVTPEKPKSSLNYIDSEKTNLSKDSIVEEPTVTAAVFTKDDPNLPCLTFRFWVMSTFFTSLGAAISQFYYFRPNIGYFSIFFVVLVSNYIGKWMAALLPTRKFRIWRWEFSFNPGPFNIKEHVCITVAASTGGVSAYATDIIAIQELFYHQTINFVTGFLLLMSTQILGYGLAGFLRKYLVRPANMIWPSNLVFASMFNTLHGNLSETPPYDRLINRLGSGYHGVGLLNFSLDWNAIGQVGPLFTPWWAQVNYFFGAIVGAWIIAPLLYYANVFEAQKFPFIARYSLDKYGQKYNQSAIIDEETGSLNITAYENYSPVYLSVTFAFSYLYSFISITSAMMRIYPEIPNTWYAIIFIVMLIIAIILGYKTDANLPWWGLLLAVGLAAVMVLPIGVIQAISFNQVGLNVISEMICGYILPGRPIANVYFKCYGFMTMSQCLLLVSDLKLGHYMKIPPRSMFVSQMYGTVIGGLINYWVLKLIIISKRPYLDGTMDDPTGQWTGFRSQVFNTASIVWGLIGPARTFGSGSIYNPLLWGFVIGFVAPVPFYLLHRKFPKLRLDLVNIPLICTGLQLLPENYTNFIISGIFVSFMSQFYAYRYNRRWWEKYNYVLSAAFASAAQIVTMIIFFFLNGVIMKPFPEWWGNNHETQGERCFAQDK
ncbi:11728_t:CDS:10 [Funneliformis geosporum]|uniref:1615_t:CDS:1 n=1 Tax=Funneliformis geosporum TaxID=1117311 RepID=A0A9W4WJH1_9GLOM|nr:1615_t:CDS:10 [Funneliformis geosporum]CAI2167224.1 11728_t:CDS:10 [Funneliformis geosporum]